MNQTDGRPTIGHHPRASRLATNDELHDAAMGLRNAHVAAAADGLNERMVSVEEIHTALEDARNTRQAITRMIGWRSILPESAIVDLRTAQMLADGIVEGLVNALREVQKQRLGL